MGSELNGLSSNTDNVWDLKPMERGKEIQRREGRNLPNYFPVIAIYNDGKAISIKSIDVESITYKKPANLKSKILEFINDLVNLKDNTYLDKKITIETRDLIIVVPQGSINEDIDTVIKECEIIASQYGVNLVVKDCYGRKSEIDNNKIGES